jgi:hypothetical protein
MNAVLVPLTRIPGFRKKVFADMKHHMIAPFAPVLADARPETPGRSQG